MAKIKFSIDCPTCRKKLIEKDGLFDNDDFINLHSITLLEWYCECCETTWCVDEVEISDLKDI